VAERAQRRLHAWRHGPAAALLLALLASPAARALAPDGAAGLQARLAALAPQLRDNGFGAPLDLESTQGDRQAQGDIYVLVAAPFGTVSTALAAPAHWCDIMMLHLNTKSCRLVADTARPRLEIRIGRKFDQPTADAEALTFSWREAARTSDYLEIALDSPSGPFGTHDYRILLQATPADAEHSFIHMSYAFGYGALGRIALNVYLATVARDKVGFSAAVPASAGGPAQPVRGLRGLVERNTMRYALAIQTYLDALRLPEAQRRDWSLRQWFAATERYPRQLHETDLDTYLAMKRDEFDRQRAPVRAAPP